MPFVVIDRAEVIQSLRSSMAANTVLQPHPEEASIIKYLLAGKKMNFLHVIPHDEIDPTRQNNYKYITCTDGVYIWCISICHYIETYHARLPDDFVDRMRRHSWTPPEVTPARWNSVLRFYPKANKEMIEPEFGFDEPGAEETDLGIG